MEIDSSNSVINKKKQKKHYNRNLEQIFILSFDALRERKARSALTILMVVVGSGLMVALNGMSAGQTDFINKSLNTLRPMNFWSLLARMDSTDLLDQT